MSENELKEYFNLYTDTWKFFKKYHAAASDREWNDLMKEADVVAKKKRSISGKTLAEQLILATIDEIQRIYKTRKG